MKRVFPNRTEWRIDGQLHRKNGPAVIYVNSNRYYYIRGKLHRENGPAIIYSNGDKRYFINGKLHREDGPAFIDNNYHIGKYFIYGKELTEKEYNMYNFVKSL